MTFSKLARTFSLGLLLPIFLPIACNGDVDPTHTERASTKIEVPRTEHASTAAPTAATTPPSPAAAPPVLSQDRAIDWSESGVVGPDGTRGIPNLSTVCTTIDAQAFGNGAADATAAIQDAIASCPDGQAVQLSSGTFRLANVLNVNRSIVLRGAGAKLTTVNVFGNPGARGHVYFNAGSTFGKVKEASWTAGYAKDSKDIVLDDATGLSVGQEIWLDQLNDTALVNPTGNEGLNCCSGRTGDNFGNGGHTRAQLQVNRVAAKTGASVTLERPLYFSASSALSPQAVWWSSGTAAGNLKWAGIEDMTLDGAGIGSSSQDAIVNFDFCSFSWVKGVEIRNVPSRGVRFFVGYRNELRDSYIHDAERIGSQAYGVELDQNSASLVENNGFSGLVASVMLGFPNSGNVIAYNYVTNNAPGSSWQYPSFNGHDAHNFMNLFEGNVGDLIYFDFIHGSGSHQTLYRNRLFGVTSGKTGQTYAIGIEAWNRYTSVVGNVLGTAGYHTQYERTLASPEASGERALYYVGFFTTNAAPANYDPDALSTLLRDGNYDYVNGAVVWNDGAEHALADSLYLKSKPLWFGDLPWPPIDPRAPGGSDDPARIPAGYRLVNGQPPPGSL